MHRLEQVVAVRGTGFAGPRVRMMLGARGPRPRCNVQFGEDFAHRIQKEYFGG